MPNTIRVCRNSRCGEAFSRWEGGGILGFCPSCRAAGAWGAGLAFAAGVVYHILAWWFGWPLP